METINGLDALRQKLTDFRKSLPQAVGKAMYQFAEEVMGDSKGTYVPVDTGALMNTGHVDPPVISGTSVTVELGYGDESVGYALIVHEELGISRGHGPGKGKEGPRTAGHPINWTRPGSGPKYLETPFKTKQDLVPQRIVDAVTELLK